MSAPTAAIDANIPMADGLPVLGSAVAMLRNPLQFLKAQRERHGDVFRVAAGPRKMVVLSGVDACRFMNEEGKQCLHSRGFWGKLTEVWDCPHLLTGLDGEQHINDRREFKATLSKKIADDRQQALIDIVLDTVADYTSDSPVISARDLTRTLTNSELYHLVTGESPDVDRATARSLAEYQRIVFNVMQLGKWPRLMFLTPQYLYHRHRAMRFVKGLIDEYRDNPPESGWFKIVLELQKQPGRTEGDLLFNFFAPFWAGLDTLGSSLTFLLQELTHNEPLRKQLVEELDQAIADNGGVLPDADALRSLPILFGICMEVLRLYPVAFANPRTAACDFEFKGFRIRKDEEVMIFTTATHFDAQHFKDPECFDVTRYGKARSEHRQRFVFNPYGRGPHICLGAAMAESMYLTTVATLFSSFDVQAVNTDKHYPMIFDPSPTLPYSFKIALSPRVSQNNKMAQAA